MPKEEIENDIAALIRMTHMICNIPSLKPIIGKRARIITACMVDTIVPLSALPITIDNLDTGATRISFINPNSLSHIMDMDEKIELKRIVIPSIPGKINWIYGTPVSGDTSRDIPAPTINNHKSGLAIVEKRRLLSLTNFLNSLATFTLTALNSLILPQHK